MPLTALLLLLAAAPEPAAAPAGNVVRAFSLSLGPSRGELYGLRLEGGGLHLGYGAAFATSEPGWTWGVGWGLALGRTRTPAGLAVTEVATDFALHLGAGPGRLGAGVELRRVDVERRTSTEEPLAGIYLDGIAFLSVDVVRSHGAAAFLEVRVQGIASVPVVGQVLAGVRL
jgi:hypothetical protein